MADFILCRGPEKADLARRLCVLFKPERVADEDAYNRIATLEFLCQRYNVRVV